MKYSLIAAIALFSFASSAHAQQIRDMSLSPSETAVQPNTAKTATQGFSNQPGYAGSGQNFQNDVSRRISDMNRNGAHGSPMPPPRVGDINQGQQPAKSFMEGYCDPNFTPMLANNRRYYGQEQCLQQIRDDSCYRFKLLAAEVKVVLDSAISCLFDNSNGYVAPTNENASTEVMACAESYVHRIELLKKYMGDAGTAYALVYLPDNVLDTSGACVNRQQQGQQ